MARRTTPYKDPNSLYFSEIPSTPTLDMSSLERSMRQGLIDARNQEELIRDETIVRRLIRELNTSGKPGKPNYWNASATVCTIPVDFLVLSTIEKNGERSHDRITMAYRELFERLMARNIIERRDLSEIICREDFEEDD